MKIYIPPHIRELGIVKDLCAMIIGYSEILATENDSKNSLDYYYYYKTLDYDSVKSFVGICKHLNNSSEDENTSEDEITLENEINYITNLFYTVKGTIKVFDFLKLYLNFEFTYEYRINSNELSISLSENTYNRFFKPDEELFKDRFENFLKAVLYIKNLNIGIREVELDTIRDNKDLYKCIRLHSFTEGKLERNDDEQ